MLVLVLALVLVLYLYLHLHLYLHLWYLTHVAHHYRMHTDAIQSANVVRVVGDQGYAALFADLQLNHAEHTRDFGQAAGAAASAQAPAEEASSAAPSAPKRPRTIAPPSQPADAPARLQQLALEQQ